jgi:hypothetical protein
MAVSNYFFNVKMTDFSKWDRVPANKILLESAGMKILVILIEKAKLFYFGSGLMK